MQRIGLITDTHGLLRSEAMSLLQGCDQIIHAGDIGKPEILDALAAIAPVTAVRGNNDKGAWARRIPEEAYLEVENIRVYVIHDLGAMHVDPNARGIGVVVSGHSHRPSVTRKGAVLYVNPGSAGPRRFRLPVAAAELLVEGSVATATVRDILTGDPICCEQSRRGQREGHVRSGRRASRH
jgi:phosphoesterase, MJ0936 family